MIKRSKWQREIIEIKIPIVKVKLNALFIDMIILEIDVGVYYFNINYEYGVIDFERNYKFYLFFFAHFCKGYLLLERYVGFLII